MASLLFTDPLYLSLVIDSFIGEGEGCSSDLLSLGRIALSNKEAHTLVLELPLWEKLYKSITDAAERGYHRSGGADVLYVSWNGESGLPKVFLSSAVSVTGSWMPACCMLLSHSCKYCGCMVSKTQPSC
jgi:hypothetical protein